MMFLATFFPMPDLEEEDTTANFDLVHDFFPRHCRYCGFGRYLPRHAEGLRQGKCQDSGSWARMGYG